MRGYSVMVLTETQCSSNLVMQLPHVAVGPGISKPHGASRFNAVFLCAKSQFISMLGWAGSRKAGRVVCPLCQPVQPDSMIGIVLSGLLPTHTEAIMPKFNAQEPINTLNLSVSEKPTITELALIEASITIGSIAESNAPFTKGIACYLDSLNKRISEITVFELIDLLNKYRADFNNQKTLVPKKTSRFNILDKSKQVIAERVTFDQARQYQNCIVKFSGMEVAR